MTIHSGNLIANITGGVFTSAIVQYPDDDYPTDSPAAVLASYIVGALLMSVPSDDDVWPLYVSTLPEGVDELGAVFNTTPVKDGRIMDGGDTLQHYGIEILIRALTEEVGWGRCVLIAEDLDTIHNETVVRDAVSYQIRNVSRVGGINSLGQEEGTKRRRLFSINFIMALEEL